MKVFIYLIKYTTGEVTRSPDNFFVNRLHLTVCLFQTPYLFWQAVTLFQNVYYFVSQVHDDWKEFPKDDRRLPYENFYFLVKFKLPKYEIRYLFYGAQLGTILLSLLFNAHFCSKTILFLEFRDGWFGIFHRMQILTPGRLLFCNLQYN